MYDHLFCNEVHSRNTKLWKSKTPLKVKIFMWLLQQNAILTKDNLIKTNWHGHTSCYFRNTDESIEHLLFDCAVARCIWSLISFTIGASCR
jgi:hypothetical protein